MNTPLRWLQSKRKYVLSWGIFVGCLVALLADRLADEIFGNLMEAVIWAFIVGNIGEHATKAWQNRASTNSPEEG